MNRLRNPKVLGTLRHLLSSIGPVLGLISAIVGSGQLSLLDVLTIVATQWEILVGLLMAAVAFWASWSAKEKQGGG